MSDDLELIAAAAMVLSDHLARLRTERQELLLAYKCLARRWHHDNIGFVGNHPNVLFEDCTHPDCVLARKTIFRYGGEI